VYTSLVDNVVAPLARAWSPELVLVSAGYDAHYEDPLAECRVSEDGFAAMARSVSAVCSELEVPLGCVLEGGYALGPLARSVAATMAALTDGGGPTGTAEIVPLARDARERVGRWWPALA
jgi:acetoin utilization deacetylase AcuC-like enzyme